MEKNIRLMSMTERYKYITNMSRSERFKYINDKREKLNKINK